MADALVYKGIVEDVDSKKRQAVVALLDAPRCSGCAIASACGSRPSSATVSVSFRSGMEVKKGDRVEVKCPPSSSTRAMLWGIVYPCVWLIAVTLVLSWIGVDDSVIPAWALGSVAVYYAILFMLRRFINKKLEWTIVSTDSHEDEQTSK